MRRDPAALLGQRSSAGTHRPSYIRFCAVCDHPEGDHGGRAGWHGPRRGPCFVCDCERFTQEGEMPCTTCGDNPHTENCPNDPEKEAA